MKTSRRVDPAASAAARVLGRLGGPARAAKLSPKPSRAGQPDRRDDEGLEERGDLEEAEA